MTPEEKAEEIINKFKELYQYPTMSDFSKKLVSENAKSCAIICVEQIIGATGADKDENNGYWQRVIHYLKNS